MHEQAVLVTDHPLLGNAEAPVGIDTVEEHFSTSSAANAGIQYRCANPKCKVPVIAVITKLSKAKRKNSPSSYFRAKRSKPHVAGCDRQPVPTTPPVTTAISPVSQASPTRTNEPTVWIDPLTSGVATSGGSNGGGPGGAPGSGSRGTRSASGSGTSQGHSQMVERFAKEWLTMNAATQKATALNAPWNLGGTYHSAFHPFAYHRREDVLSTGKKIYVGVVGVAAVSETGSVITLLDQNSDGAVLEIHVPTTTFAYGTAGSALQAKLIAVSNAPNGARVFALGAFAAVASGSLSLAIPHPHYIYFP